MVFPFGLWHRTQQSVTSTGREPEFVGEAASRSRGAARVLDVRGRRRITQLDRDLDDVDTSVRRTAISSNSVEVLEVDADEAAAKLRSRSPVWADIRRDGRVVHGLGLDELRGAPSA
jgi:hypothetical protein